MAKDWSATQQAAYNLQAQRNDEAMRKVTEMFKRDVECVDIALNQLNMMSIDESDPDLLAAIRALGALKARMLRKFYKHTEYVVET